VVHLGDRDVPNALVFIDKYCQVPRILSPILKVLRSADGLATEPRTREYIRAISDIGDAQTLRMAILQDFFKHGFDGDGDDGGSCIDGRLTSAWNWCAKVEKKKYWRCFLLAGFVGFDGDDGWR